MFSKVEYYNFGAPQTTETLQAITKVGYTFFRISTDYRNIQDYFLGGQYVFATPQTTENIRAAQNIKTIMSMFGFSFGSLKNICFSFFPYFSMILNKV